MWSPRTGSDEVFNSATVDLIKSSGNEDEWYGFTVCDTRTGFYSVGISVSGFLSVVRKNGDSYNSIFYEDSAEGMNTGYNQVNRVTISRSDSVFTISVNGGTAYTFTDSSFTSGALYFYCMTAESGSENFPDEPCDVRM